MDSFGAAVVFFGEVERLDAGFEVFFLKVAVGFREEAEEGLWV